ncbi:MAG: hypothetical protein IJC98_05855 [Clostridia bacterium]|nr:hypothetical protein [Clostridia bacterium]
MTFKIGNIIALLLCAGLLSSCSMGGPSVSDDTDSGTVTDSVSVSETEAESVLPTPDAEIRWGESLSELPAGEKELHRFALADGGLEFVYTERSYRSLGKTDEFYCFDPVSERYFRVDPKIIPDATVPGYIGASVLCVTENGGEYETYAELLYEGKTEWRKYRGPSVEYDEVTGEITAVGWIAADSVSVDAPMLSQMWETYHRMQDTVLGERAASCADPAAPALPDAEAVLDRYYDGADYPLEFVHCRSDAGENRLYLRNLWDDRYVPVCPDFSDISHDAYRILSVYKKENDGVGEYAVYVRFLDGTEIFEKELPLLIQWTEEGDRLVLSASVATDRRTDLLGDSALLRSITQPLWDVPFVISRQTFDPASIPPCPEESVRNEAHLSEIPKGQHVLSRTVAECPAAVDGVLQKKTVGIVICAASEGSTAGTHAYFYDMENDFYIEIPTTVAELPFCTRRILGVVPGAVGYTESQLIVEYVYGSRILWRSYPIGFGVGDGGLVRASIAAYEGRDVDVREGIGLDLGAVYAQIYGILPPLS